MQKIASEILSARQFECGQEQHEHLCVPYLWDPDGKRYFSWDNTFTTYATCWHNCIDHEIVRVQKSQTHLMSSIITLALSFVFCPL